MNRSLGMFVVGVVALISAAPALVCLSRALVPLVLVVAVSVAVVRAVFFFTDRRL